MATVSAQEVAAVRARAIRVLRALKRFEFLAIPRVYHHEHTKLGRLGAGRLPGSP